MRKGASFEYILSRDLLEDTFRQFGKGASARFLLQHVLCGINQLLEDEFRKFGNSTSLRDVLKV
ncbi:hypothetical protein FE257_002303 [Aspergillus nanangensis]|uniref:Uncharacterized protein n=1 Tax=Aspergillus nanangensis TaxID=2582783 RepID=A0AAD4CDY4_ASPNN|nr:hypothetical protein FE257_002303 [Aspergillus nanangensis]